jgi:sugar lactone lactonase YvrE
MTDVQTFMTGIAFGESPRWHEHRLWFSDWGAEELIAVDLAGKSEVVLHVASFPFSIDWLPDGRLLIASARDGLLLCQEPDGSLVAHADLHSLADTPWNEIVVDGRGNTYLNNVGFDFPGGEFVPGKAPSGMGMSATGGACASRKAVRCCRPSSLIVAASRVCWAARTGERCSWWRGSGVAWRARPTVNEQDRS